MPHIVTTNAANVSLPWQPSLTAGLNSRTIVSSGTVVTLNDFEFAALSPTAFTSGSLLDGGDTTLIGFTGTKVSRPTANLPQSAAVDIFSISGGRIQIVNLIGTITTAVQAQATLLRISYTPSGGASQTLMANTTDWTGATVGTQFVAKLNAVTDVFSATTAASGITFPPVEAQQPQVMLAAGKLSAVTVASSTGQVRWDIWYIPVDAGATVTPL